MTKVLVLGVACVLISSCGGTISDSRISGFSAGSEYIAPIETVIDRRYAGIIRQQYDFSCGSAALATLLRYHYGDGVGEAAVFKGMWSEGDRAQIRHLGFSLLDMKRYLKSRGLNADGFKVSLEDVAKGGVPGVALINVNGYKHFVVIKGVKDNEVLVGDPSLGLMAVPAAKFQKYWNGVFFIIEPSAQKGRFNVPSHWASFTRAPTGNGFNDPLSQQALALTAPFYRDF